MGVRRHTETRLCVHVRTMDRFATDKSRVLSERVDHSRKGSVDTPIVALVERINRYSQFYTTSSCSGRIVVFSDSVSGHVTYITVVTIAYIFVVFSQAKKKGCQWFLNSHSFITQPQLVWYGMVRSVDYFFQPGIALRMFKYNSQCIILTGCLVSFVRY